uniref:Orf c04043 protein n=1 Tax=Saccharolobus solfataricus TaxID=2287 RepID=P95981_SACSO|nr:orf c04043 [Saccharolobus solfataricus P2]
MSTSGPAGNLSGPYSVISPTFTALLISFITSFMSSDFSLLQLDKIPFALSMIFLSFSALMSSISISSNFELYGPTLSTLSTIAAINAVSILSKFDGIIISPSLFPPLVFTSTIILPNLPLSCNSLRSNSSPNKFSVWPNIAPITSVFSTIPSTSNLNLISYFIWKLTFTLPCYTFGYLLNHFLELGFLF